TVCFLIELIKNGNSTFGIAAADDEFFTTTKYRDIQCRRNLTQVLVHRSAQVGEPLVVERFGGEVGRLNGGLGFQNQIAGRNLLFNDDLATQGVTMRLRNIEIDHLSD